MVDGTFYNAINLLDNTAGIRYLNPSRRLPQYGAALNLILQIEGKATFYSSVFLGRCTLLEKYFIYRNSKSGDLTIEEKAVLNPIKRGSDVNRISDDIFRLVYSVTYSKEKIESAIENGRSSLIATIRSRNFFPIKIHCEAIADAIIRIFNNNKTSEELLFDAKDLFTQPQEE